MEAWADKWHHGSFPLWMRLRMHNFYLAYHWVTNHYFPKGMPTEVEIENLIINHKDWPHLFDHWGTVIFSGIDLLVLQPYGDYHEEARLFERTFNLCLQPSPGNIWAPGAATFIFGEFDSTPLVEDLVSKGWLGE